MAIEPIEVPDLKLESLSEEDRATLDKFLFEFQNKINEIIRAFNTEHP